MTITDQQIGAEIESQTSKARSVAPRDIATKLVEQFAVDMQWQKLLPRIRSVAQKMEQGGSLVFIRKRKVVPSAGLRGVYRLAKPEQLNDDNGPASETE